MVSAIAMFAMLMVAVQLWNNHPADFKPENRPSSPHPGNNPLPYTSHPVTVRSVFNVGGTAWFHVVSLLLSVDRQPSIAYGGPNSVAPYPAPYNAPQSVLYMLSSS